MGKKLALITSLIFIIASFHTLSHIILQGGLSNSLDSGISGLSIGKISIDEVKPQYKEVSQTSLYILGAEWSLLIFLSISAFIKHKSNLKENMKTLPLLSKYKAKTKTDLDILYEILKEKKHLRISTISKIFNISQEIALSWAKTLESGSLAAIHYPRVGEPELTIIE
ncbi:MAG: hypothetical protein Q7S27_03620 [Nanoarchaeota archaeon]|nr:hypothetical protein [Nanoarchaeota archaeon]